MIVADTSALVSLATIDLIGLFLTEFNVHTSETVLEELRETARYNDSHGFAAETVIDARERMTVHHVDDVEISSSRIDPGEGSCVRLTNELDAAFLITDDLRALPELQALIDARVAISPIVLQALVKRDALEPAEAKERLSRLAESRDWLGAPIYRRARSLFDDG